MPTSNLDKAKTKLVIAEPFYATMLNLKAHSVNNANPTCSTGKEGQGHFATDGANLVVNTDYFEALPLSRLPSAALPGTRHCCSALMHPFPSRHRHPDTLEPCG